MKRTKKSILAILLAGFMLFGSTACGGNDSESAPSSESTSETSEWTSEITSESTSESASELTSELTSEATSEFIEEEETEFVPIFRMAVVSDIHVYTPNAQTIAYYEKTIETAYAYADGHETYKTLDAFVITGDIANDPSSDKDVFTAVLASTQKCLREETVWLPILGNHDLYSFNNGSRPNGAPYLYDGLTLYKEAISEEINKHVEVKGFHLIGLSNITVPGYIDQSGIDMAKQWMATSNAEDPDKPIFTFQHHKIPNTVLGSGDGSVSAPTENTPYGTSWSKLDEAYKQYSQVINFSGHSHHCQNTTRAIHQRDYTSVDVTAYASMGFPTAGTGGTTDRADMGLYYRIVEVSADYRVRIYSMSALTGEFAKTPSTTDDPEEILVYKIAADKDVSKFVYTDDRVDKASAPYFAEGAALTFAKNSDGEDYITNRNCKIVIPQMMDADNPYYYEIKAVNTKTGEEVYSTKIIDDFYHGENEDEEVFITKLKTKTEYTITVTPYNIWHKAGEPLTLNVTTI